MVEKSDLLKIIKGAWLGGRKSKFYSNWELVKPSVDYFISQYIAAWCEERALDIVKRSRL